MIFYKELINNLLVLLATLLIVCNLCKIVSFYLLLVFRYQSKVAFSLRNASFFFHHRKAFSDHKIKYRTHLYYGLSILNLTTHLPSLPTISPDLSVLISFPPSLSFSPPSIQRWLHACEFFLL